MCESDGGDEPGDWGRNAQEGQTRKSGDLCGDKDGVHSRLRRRRAGCTGVTAPIVAMKPGNAGGAKGRQEGGYLLDRQTETQPAAVPPEAKQAGNIEERWLWVEPSVWTERMLTALEQGVKGGKWPGPKLLLCAAWAAFLEPRLCGRWSTLSEVKPPTGEPYAGDPHVRFGGRGSRDNRLSLPLFRLTGLREWGGLVPCDFS